MRTICYELFLNKNDLEFKQNILSNGVYKILSKTIERTTVFDTKAAEPVEVVDVASESDAVESDASWFVLVAVVSVVSAVAVVSVVSVESDVLSCALQWYAYSKITTASVRK